MVNICQDWRRDMLCIVVDGHLSVFGHRNEYDPTPGFKDLNPPRDNNKNWPENNEASVLERLSRKLKTKILHWKARQNYGTGATISYEISNTSGTVR
jgi:hypothetical protein